MHVRYCVFLSDESLLTWFIKMEIESIGNVLTYLHVCSIHTAPGFQHQYLLDLFDLLYAFHWNA